MLTNEELLQKALKVAENAYAPYSQFFVGACILLEDGTVFYGCNVENASYGLSLCAERNALSGYKAQGLTSPIKKIAIASKNTKKCYPCGACRQWIKELAPESVIVVEGDDAPLEFSIEELLPKSFGL